MNRGTERALRLLLIAVLLTLLAALLLKPIGYDRIRLIPILVFKENSQRQIGDNQIVKEFKWKPNSTLSNWKGKYQAKSEVSREPKSWTGVSEALKSVPKSSAGVPKILHFMYRIPLVLNRYKKGLETCTQQNRDWMFVFWSEADIFRFIRDKYPKEFEVFVSFPHRLQRCDAARYMVLHYYGGLYVDLDMHCQKPVLSVLDNNPCYLDSERPEFTQFTHNREYIAMNSAMGCQPRHPFFKRLIDDLFQPKKLLEKLVMSEDTVSSTGPLYLTGIYLKYKREHPETDVRVLNASHFTPKFDPGVNFKRLCKPELAKQPKPGQWKTIACHTLNRIGFDKSLDAYLNNSTVAIHQFSHSGYGVQYGSTFDIRKFTPAMMFYENLTAMGL